MILNWLNVFFLEAIILAEYGQTPFEEFTEKIFQETYGKPSKAFYYKENYAIRDKIRESVMLLRKSYENSVCITPYNEEEIRKAYMIAYYPYYIAPIKKIVQEQIVPKICNKEKIFIDCFAGGPCPEVYGTVKAISDFGKSQDIDIASYDLEKGWSNYKNITMNLCKELVNKLKWLFAYNFDISAHVHALKHWRVGTKKLSERWSNETDIFLLQNYLSHVSDEMQFMTWFTNLSQLMKIGSFFVCIDFKGYPLVEKILNMLGNEKFVANFNLSVNNKCIPSRDAICEIRHDNPSYGIRKNIFDEKTDGLHKKNITKFYYVVLQKI